MRFIWKKCKTFDELTNEIDSNMDYYNNHRFQWGLKKMTPVHNTEIIFIKLHSFFYFSLTKDIFYIKREFLLIYKEK